MLSADVVRGSEAAILLQDVSDERNKSRKMIRLMTSDNSLTISVYTEVKSVIIEHHLLLVQMKGYSQKGRISLFR